VHRIFGFLPLLVAVVSCGVDADETIDISYDACAPLALAADDASDAERASIEDAAALWNAQGLTKLVVDQPGDAPIVRIRFESAAIAFLGVYEDEIGEIIINREITNPEQRAIVIAHEVGHAFGLPHMEGRSVMNQGNLTITPTAEDQAALTARNTSCALELEADAR
jgi:hypothetical protein